MVKRFEIKGLNLTFVFRHRFEKHKEAYEKYGHSSMFRKYELGIWFRPVKIVGRKEFKTPNKWKNNLVGSYMLGVDLILCKCWVEVNYGGMVL